MELDCPSTCPFVAGPAAALDFPIGQVRRLAPANPVATGEVDETKRNVLKLLVAAGVVGAAGGRPRRGFAAVRPASHDRGDRLRPRPAARPRRHPADRHQS